MNTYYLNPNLPGPAMKIPSLNVAPITPFRIPRLVLLGSLILGLCIFLISTANPIFAQIAAPTPFESMDNLESNPIIQGIEPQPIYALNKRQWVKITGKGFRPGALVEFRLFSKVYSIPRDRFRYQNENRLDAFVNLSGKPETWQVRIIDPGGKASLWYSFNVEAFSTKKPNEDRQKAFLKEEEAADSGITESLDAIEKIEKQVQNEKAKTKQPGQEPVSSPEKTGNPSAPSGLVKNPLSQTTPDREKGDTVAKPELALNENKKSAQNPEPEKNVQSFNARLDQIQKEAALTKAQIKQAESRVATAQKNITATQANLEQVQSNVDLLKNQTDPFTDKKHTGLAIGGVFLLGIFVLFVIRSALNRLENALIQKDSFRENGNPLRFKNITDFIKQTSTWIVLILTLIVALGIMGIDTLPIFIGLTVVILTFGIGGQHLIRDIINGFLILIEGQYYIHDWVQIGGHHGLVEDFNLRHTRIRNLEGGMVFIPNRDVHAVINFSRDFAHALVDLGVSYKENIDEVIEVLKDLGKEMRDDPHFRRYILKELEVLGIEDLAETQVNLRCRIKTLPLKQWSVARELRRRVKNRFDELGIELPHISNSALPGKSKKPNSEIAAKERRLKKKVIGQTELPFE